MKLRISGGREKWFSHWKKRTTRAPEYMQVSANKTNIPAHVKETEKEEYKWNGAHYYESKPHRFINKTEIKV